MNSIYGNLDVKISSIATDEESVLQLIPILNANIIFIDSVELSHFSKKFLRIYRHNIVSLTYNPNFKLMDAKNIRFIKKVIKRSDLAMRKKRIEQELEYLGYKPKYKGTHYLVDTIMQLCSNNDNDNTSDNLQKDIYPIIAKKYNKPLINVKSNINKATECMYYECDIKKLENYFHFSYDTKPTIKQVIYTVMGNIKN